MIRNLKYFLLALLASVLFNSCFVVEKQNVETSSKESYTSTQPSVSEVRSTSASTETDLTDYSYLDGSWYEDTLHEKSNLRDYFYRIKGNQISVVDKKHNKKETFFGFKISNGKVTISSKGEDSKKIAPGTYPISIKSENQFTISFAKPMSFIRNTYAHDQAEAFVEKATDISLGAGAISGLSGALDMGVQTAIDGLNAKDAIKKAAEEANKKALKDSSEKLAEKTIEAGGGAIVAKEIYERCFRQENRENDRLNSTSAMKILGSEYDGGLTYAGRVCQNYTEEYGKGSAGEINRAARNGNITDDVKALDGVIASCKTSAPVDVIRATTGKFGNADYSVVDGKVYYNDGSGLKVCSNGTVIKDSAFGSFTTDRNTAESMWDVQDMRGDTGPRILSQVNVPQGTNAVNVTSVNVMGENETILHRNAEYKVKSVSYDEKLDTIIQILDLII